MTSRPGRVALDSMRLDRGKRICHAVKVIPQTLPPLLFTDHDRTLTVDGETYSPTSFGTLSADRREAAFRSGNQEIRGTIDGVTITLPQFDAHRYRGAEVQIAVIDWQMPWVVFSRHRKWIRSVVRDGSSFIGTMEGRTQSLQRPSGGRFGGTFATTCPYELGDAATCKKDISADSHYVYINNIVDSRRTFRAWTATMPSTSDNYYRDGSIEWVYGPSTPGAAWTGLTTSTLTDSTQSWTTDEHAGRYILIIDASGLLFDHALVLSNTATVVTFETIASASATAGIYAFADKSIIAGSVSPIVGFTNSTREIDLLIPTPVDIPLGTWGIVRPGCDGLLSTCRTKFSNQLNHGGDPFAPSSTQIIEPVEDQ
jgi:uncharacterized phage protein (TIGR02218 family)